MQRLQAYKFAVIPSGGQERLMRCFAGSCRFVFNKALALQKQMHENGEKRLNYAGLCKLLTEWRNGTETPWLKDAPTHPLQQALKNVERAYTNFLLNEPNFHVSRRKDCAKASLSRPKQIKVDQANSRIFLPKLGWMRYRNSRMVLGAVKTSLLVGTTANVCVDSD